MKKSSSIENKSGWLIGGGVFAALTASVCCVGPLILTVLGISGAAALTKFEFVRTPMILVVTLLFLAAGWSLFKTKSDCSLGSICANPIKYRRMLWAYWIGLVIAIIVITLPYWILWISD